ncbi:hypothetical protein [Microscilla marina]|uniref:Uncharacterized protein n=1 Tax=Microscilla marina ATCC 23134 TaxID=313606 RepID=A1ZND3_MICM2|nr:hypothetical protein [Microscilla marina]EAY28044.1 hypothetical protein M23134_02154 [Microscilla marina ATCC 23134]
MQFFLFNEGAPHLLFLKGKAVHKNYLITGKYFHQKMFILEFCRNSLSMMTTPTIGTFSLSRNLRLLQDKKTVSIQRLYKYRWLYVSVLGIMSITLIFFTLMIAYLAFAEGRPAYLGGVALFLIIDISMFFLLRNYIFSKEVLTLDLAQKTVGFRFGRKKRYHFSFAEVTQWQLRGEIYQHSRGKYVHAKLYLILASPQAQVAGKQYLTLFTFLPSGLGMNDSPKTRESAYQRGKEVCEKLQELTQIPWKWYDYQKIR